MKTYVSTLSRHLTSCTHNDYSLILQSPPLTFMAAICCVITSSPRKMKMVFIHTKMSSLVFQRIELPGWRALVCGHVCLTCIHTRRLKVRVCAFVSITVCVCATAGCQVHLYELSLPSGTAANPGSFKVNIHSFIHFLSLQLKLEVCVWHINLKTNNFLNISRK